MNAAGPMRCMAVPLRYPRTPAACRPWAAPNEGSRVNVLPHPPGDEPHSGLNLPLLYNVVYCSRADASVDEAAVERILVTARRWNPVHGVTGMLVFGSGIFFQWLEGPRSAVQELMAKLRADPRHSDVIEFSVDEEVRERLFPTWDMERVDADAVRDVLTDALDAAKSPQHAASLRVLLEELDAGRLAELGQG